MLSHLVVTLFTLSICKWSHPLFTLSPFAAILLTQRDGSLSLTCKWMWNCFIAQGYWMSMLTSGFTWIVPCGRMKSTRRWTEHWCMLTWPVNVELSRNVSAATSLVPRLGVSDLAVRMSTTSLVHSSKMFLFTKTRYVHVWWLNCDAPEAKFSRTPVLPVTFSLSFLSSCWV
jgi:hypothetical protein